MEQTLDLGGLTAQISADQIQRSGDRARLTGRRVTVTLPEPPRFYFRHGWQSWSLAAWTGLSPLPLQRPRILHPMETDPLYINEPRPNGSWFGAVELDDGRVLLLGALGLETHVRLNGQTLEGWSEAGAAEWLVAWGSESTVFADYVDLLAEGPLGRLEHKPAPRVWCSWYSLYTAIDEDVLGTIFDGLGDLPFDVLQVDDGWQLAVGDWTPNAKFPGGMPALAKKIRRTGRRAGLWLAPLIAARSSRLFRQHPDWFLKDPQGRFVSAGFNWSDHLHALDTTHPAALEWLADLVRQVRGWGFDYLKLDFLYAGALPGVRFQEMPREAAYRQALRVLRQAMGPRDAYFLACAAPILPSLGLCDALRVGPDVAGEWENHRDAVLLSNPTTPGVRNAIRTTLHQLWLRPLVQLDPDVAYFSSHANSLTPEQKRSLQDLCLICGFKATSELPQWLSEQERRDLQAFLQDDRKPVQVGRYAFQLGERTVDFTPLIGLPAPAKGLEILQAALFAWLGDQPWALRLFDRLNQRAFEKLKKELTSST